MSNNPWEDIATPDSEYSVRLISDKHPLKLFWGKDVHGGYLFIAQFSSEAAPDKKSLPELAGIRIAMAPAPDCCRLVLLLNEVQNWEIFKALCVDLTHASESYANHSEAVNVIVGRLRRWHEFLKREKQHALSEEEVKGLIGELLFMRETLVPKFGWADAVSFWKGPLGAPQDFTVHDIAVEIKVQSGSAKPYVHISSLEQLETQLPSLYLVVNTLATTNPDDKSGFTLNSLVREIQTELYRSDDFTRDLFESLVLQTGYEPIEHYDSPSFRCIVSRSFAVGEGFPRLMVANVPSGITKATYQISLDACMPFESEIAFD